MSVHVYPVPGCMTAEDAWDEIEAFGELVDQRWFWQRWWCRRRHGPRRWAVKEVLDA